MKYLVMVGMVFLSVPQFASAETQLGFSTYLIDVKTSGPNANGDGGKQNISDVKLNTSVGPVYLGGIFESEGGDNSASAYGVTLGIRGKSGYFGQVHYFLSGEYKDGSDELKKGSGLGIDVGYNAMLGSTFYLGLQFAHRSITYKEFNTTTAENKLTTLRPMINFGVMF